MLCARPYPCILVYKRRSPRSIDAIEVVAQMFETLVYIDQQQKIYVKYQVPAMGDVFTAASQMTRDWVRESQIM